MSREQTARRGFTLIELLVVIAIIAILAAILFPVFARARERAEQTACTSNVKEIGMAWLQYVQDYDEQFPPRNAPTKADGVTPSPDYGLQPQPAPGAFPCKPCRPLDKHTGLPYNSATWAMPYIKSTNIFHCPSDNGIPNVAADPTQGKPVWQVEGSSYCLNTVMTRVGRLAAIPYPAETYMGAEVYSWHWQPSNATLLWSGRSGQPTRVAYFTDGHARTVSEAFIAQQCSPPAIYEDRPGASHVLVPVP